MNLLETLLGKAPTKTRSTEVLSWLMGGTTLVGLILFALGQSLRLPAHFGVEDWLSWEDPATLQATLDAWGRCQVMSRVPAATAYLLIDTALFMPLYGLTLLWATRQVKGTLMNGGLMAWPIRVLYWLAALLLVAMWCTDAVENFGGLVRLGISWGWGVGALALAIPTFWLLRRWATTAETRDGVLAIVWLALSLLIVSVASYTIESHTPLAPAWPFRGWAHDQKKWFVLAALLPLAVLWLCWWFGLDLDSKLHNSANKAAEIRSACRQVALGVIGRSRYVLAMLMLFAAFTLMLDQCRDVLLALAVPKLQAWRFIIMGIGAIGLGMLCHACWLWARLVGRVKRSGYDVSNLDGVADWAGEWARSWARLLMLAPLLITVVLIANVAGDAVIAAKDSQEPGVLLETMLILAGFAVAIIGLALWLIHQRRQGALLQPADYYNCVPAVRLLLLDPYYLAAPNTSVQNQLAQSRLGHLVSVLAQPIWQPLTALAFLLVVRAVMLLAPDASSTAPPTLAVLALSIVWWLGPLGLIAMAEQRAVFPWALLLLIVAGIVGLVSDNHTLPTLVIHELDSVPGTLAELGRVALSALSLLAVISALVWLILVLPASQFLGIFASRRDKGHESRRHVFDDVMRFVLSTVCVVILCFGLAGIDHWAASVMPPSDPEKAAKNGTARAQDRSVFSERDKDSQSGNPPLLLVASEGGGARAAYWTARVLAAMEKEHPGWDSRIVAMSGVSGGSMGIAAWRACARDSKGQRSASGEPVVIETCVRERFSHLDALSPLVAGLLFDDVWMRLLPTDWLCDASSGCGIRSRAMAFEREWMRAFPRLAQPLGAPLEGEPELLLNSTVVETGNRGVLSTQRFAPGELPGAEDLIVSGRVPSSPALVTAAHTSARFPFTNPLASLPHQASGPAAAHLVDGGYHDNSGTASLSDVLTRLRTKYPDHRFQLVLIRNGQVPTNCLPQAVKENQDEPPTECLKTSSSAYDLRLPRDAQRLELFADLFGPAVTVLNNLGTGAHGREPVAALTARLAAGVELPKDKGCTDDAPVCLLDQMQDASLVPLGWSLSPAARTAMDTAATNLARHPAPVELTPPPHASSCSSNIALQASPR
ncbi:patatin-like phospholipase family protein [Azohydromonas australica]|uniref:patatin-like phospholipase family protein n=1 Tax=Azohydromonas australica TaxID=364039 RepID=UPI00048C595E|nr:patatin-like phospholipase family protein [Azohydromonas australica]